jgi:hypothetical protein
MKGKNIEVIAEFERDNCIYVIKQPLEKPTEKEIKDFYTTLAKILYN